MPWYWSDEIAQILVERGSMNTTDAGSLIAMPVAFRSDEASIQKAIDQLIEDDEIPLAA